MCRSMLVELVVRDFVLIDRLELRLGRGFNVLTGETGAGKSVLVGALALVLGGRASAELVRPGCAEATVEALFQFAADPPAREERDAASVERRERLAALGVDGEEVVVRRVVQSSGRSRAYLNGRLCTAAELASLAPALVDVSSQHASVSLTDPATHLPYLDAFARVEAERGLLAERFDALAAKRRELDALREAERGRAEREAFLTFQLAGIDEVAPREDELEALTTERGRLRHAGQLAETTRRAASVLDEGEAPVCDALARIGAELGSAAAVDAALAPVVAAVESARAELLEAARTLGRYADGLEEDPARLAQVEERLFRLSRLLRQHGGSVEGALAARARLSDELALLANADARIASLEPEVASALASAAALARELSARRHAASDVLGSRLGQELAALGMGRARVVVEVAPLAGRGGLELEVDGARLERSGVDRVELLIAPNPGVEPRPLARIASGGELSRALLALKRVLADQGPACLYVFDEVDAGVGGAVAERIGRAIADVARHRQVLCITHLAPIAAFAETHFVVEKRHDAGQTSTRVTELPPSERPTELARMLGGARVTISARRAAEELLRDARAEPGV